jgi:hypothetical protein
MLTPDRSRYRPGVDTRYYLYLHAQMLPSG